MWWARRSTFCTHWKLQFFGRKLCDGTVVAADGTLFLATPKCDAVQLSRSEQCATHLCVGTFGAQQECMPIFCCSRERFKASRNGGGDDYSIGHVSGKKIGCTWHSSARLETLWFVRRVFTYVINSVSGVQVFVLVFLRVWAD